MKFESYEISYRTGDTVRCIAGTSLDRYETQDLVISSTGGARLLDLKVEAKVEICVESVTMLFSHDFDVTDQVLLNGYQSWTDTRELSIQANMTGVNNIPNAVIDHWTLDGSGDYRFAEYDNKRGHLHGYTYGYVRRDTHVEMLASLDETNGFTRIGFDTTTGSISASKETPKRALAAGEELVLTELALLDGKLDACFDAWFECMDVKARQVKPLVGYTSWYRHYYDINEQKLENDMQGAISAFKMVDTEGADRLFQIDDGYCKVGDWTDIDAVKFPNGLSPLAKEVAEASFIPGLWIAPFVCEQDSRVFSEHTEWLLRNEDGEPIKTGSHWSGGYALDTQNPAFREHISGVLKHLTADWGFKLLKVDFLYAACMIPHDGMNRGELMNDALQLIRGAVGEDVLLLGCGVPLAPAFGVVDYCRIGCDVGLDWDGKLYMRNLDRERVSTKNSLNNTIGREPLDGRAFANDPDVFFLRDDIRLSKRHRNLLLDVDCTHASMLLTSDDMSLWTAEDMIHYQDSVRTLIQRFSCKNIQEAE